MSRLSTATRRICCATAFIALAGTGFAQWRMVPGDDAIGLSAGNQQNADIAPGPGFSLAVWTDYRSNPTGSYEYETGKDVYAMRLDPAGNPVEAVPFAVAGGPGAQENPKVSWNGTNWLVVFEATVLAGTGYYYDKTLQAVRVSPSGQVLDPVPIPLYSMEPSGYGHCVASDGTNWVVVNQGTSSSNSVFAMRIAPDGTVLDPSTRRLVHETYYGRSNFRLAFAGGIFLLTFDDDYVGGIFRTSYVRFLPNLTLLDPVPRNLLPSGLAGLASNGTGFYAIWNRQLPDFSMAVSGSRIDTTGAVLDAPGANLSLNFPAQAYGYIGVLWDGARWKGYWVNNNVVRLARISSAGVVLDPGGIPVAGPTAGPAAPIGGGGVQFAWSVQSGVATDVFSAFVSSANQPGPNRGLSIGAPMQVGSDVAVGSAGAMAVYRSVTSSESRIMAQPLDQAGNPLTSGPILLATGPALNGPGTPHVAWNGSNYLVAWSAGSGVVARRISQSGTPLDASPFIVMASCFGPSDVAAIGDTYFVAGRKFGYSPQYISAVGARVRGSDGAVLDASPLILGGQYVARPPAVVELGGRFFVAYHSNVTHDDPMCFTQGNFVPTSGAAAAAFGIHGPFSTAGGNGIFEIGLASNGSRAIVLQSQELTSGVENDLLCRFVESNGAVSGVTNLTPWPGNQYRPRASWDGRHFLITYQEQKNRIAQWTLDQLDARSDLYAMRVTAAGLVVDTMGFVLSSLPAAETDPTVGSNAGTSIFAGSLMTAGPAYAAYRVHTFARNSANLWPVAVATATPSSGDIPLQVAFNSAGSNDPDGTIAGYHWDFGDGQTSTQPNPSHLYVGPGPFSVNLTVTDNLGATARQTITVDATRPNIAPIAVARIDPPGGYAPLDVICYADGSYDPDGLIGNIHWEFSDGGEYWGSVAYHTFAKPGKHKVTLTVYDSRFATGTTVKNVWIFDKASRRFP